MENGSKKLKPRPNGQLAIVALAILATFAYLKTVSQPMLSDWQAFQQLDLEVQGSFLAGLFAPPAFGWLVLGYFLQWKELSQQVEASRSMAHALMSELELIRVDCAPVLRCKLIEEPYVDKEITLQQVELTNIGGTVEQLFHVPEPEVDLFPRIAPSGDDPLLGGERSGNLEGLISEGHPNPDHSWSIEKPFEGRDRLNLILVSKPQGGAPVKLAFTLWVLDAGGRQRPWRLVHRPEASSISLIPKPQELPD